MEPDTTTKQQLFEPDVIAGIDTGLDSSKLSHSPIPVGRQLAIALGLLVVIFGATYIGTVTSLIRPTTNAQDVIVSEVLSESDEKQIAVNAFEGVTLTGRAAFVWDVQAQRTLFNKNGDERLPLASITKLMTALVSYELLDGTETVDITLRSIQADGDSGFYDGERFTASDLTDLMLISSSNDGAAALSEAAGGSLGIGRDPETVFIEAMNIRAEELGLTQTYFNNVTGLDVSTKTAGAYGSARDVAFLMEYIITRYPEVVSLTSIDSTKVTNENGEYHIAKNTNDIVGEIPGLIASKTGYTELAGGNLVVAFDSGLNHPIVVVVLGSTQSGRFDDVLTLIDRARQQTLLTAR
jgi:D-alanyl-D-alanine carboxypeptidase (penicillin-binding protein 5/6)